MIIREVDPIAEALSVLEAAKDGAERSGLPHLFPRNEDDFIQAVGRIVTLPGMEILGAEENGKFVGGIGIMYIPYLWDPKRQLAEQIFWWTAKDAPFGTARKLVEEALRRMRHRGATPALRALEGTTGGIKRLYLKLGLKPIETLYIGQEPWRSSH